MFLDLQDMLAKMCFDESGDVKAGSLEHLEDVDPNAMMYVLTNSNQVNGAVYMCDEEVMSLIAEKLGSDLIVIPSSIHETIILKETENMSVRELNAMVEAVMRKPWIHRKGWGILFTDLIGRPKDWKKQ